MEQALVRLHNAEAYPVEVCVSAIALPLVSLRHVVVDHDVDTLDIDASSHEVSGHQDALLPLLELFVDLRHAQ